MQNKTVSLKIENGKLMIESQPDGNNISVHLDDGTGMMEKYITFYQRKWL